MKEYIFLKDCTHYKKGEIIKIEKPNNFMKKLLKDNIIKLVVKKTSKK